MKIPGKMYRKVPKLRYRTQVRCREGGRTVDLGKVADIIEQFGIKLVFMGTPEDFGGAFCKSWRGK